MGGGDKRGVVVPAVQERPSKWSRPRAVLEFALVVFDPPADLGQSQQKVQDGVGGKAGQPIVGGLRLVGRPLGQERIGRQGAVPGVASAGLLACRFPDRDTGRPGPPWQ